MIKYKYNLLVDFKIIGQTFYYYRWLKSKGIKIIHPNHFRMVSLWWRLPDNLPKINLKKDITCYIVSCGTWGAYQEPDKIFICPYGIKDVEDVINHEIRHLEYANETRHMTHEDREKYVDKYE